MPVGAAVPLAAFMVAVNWVVADEAMPAGLAVNVVAVLIAGAVTVTTADPLELAKFPVGE
jgi:hypothetical protein